ncbi:uncharacterized protein BO72DRAFT_409153 [Aspergillus fijiensis CBS 313.89]|uniref:C2 domain-containing protein n=1 Tax=Aspergillus fijiensis CBS 313.89 TaxID=1448319 RepID=A0A8G1VW73_9EURO|nr:uncharacterized protein BO72DRAFT_409153 [Aspergillus fijiensis CBS 313.89]RAK74912.1 hypothetical protein BO72DRAFT_409153 [Aspergillus fijiensis CBS 313.89]
MDARPSRRAMAHAAGIFADMSVDGPAIGTLVIIVDRAKNLPNRKTMGKQNPYCAARLGKEAKKTETDLRGGQTPRWDQELRFTVHESPDYFKLKVSVFNDDKKTDLIGETWIDLKDLIIPGGSQNDHWHPLQHRGKYAGEVRLEMTYYDTRPEDEAVIERRTMGTEKVHTRKSVPSAPPITLTAASSSSSSALSGPRQLKDVKRRPLPSDPTRARPSQTEKVPSAPIPHAPVRPAYHEPAQSAPAMASHERPTHLHGHPEWVYEETPRPAYYEPPHLHSHQEWTDDGPLNQMPQREKNSYPFSSCEQYVGNMPHTQPSPYGSQTSSSTTSTSDGGSTVYPCSHHSLLSSEPSTVYPYPHNYSDSGSYVSGSESIDSGPSMVYCSKSISEGGRPIPDLVWARLQPRVEDENDENNLPPPPPAHRVALVHVRNIRPPSLVSTESASSGHYPVSDGLPSNYTSVTTAVDSSSMPSVRSSLSGPSVPPSLVAGLDPVIADAESDRVTYERQARRRSGIIEENPLRKPPRESSPSPPYPMDPSLDSHSSIVTRSSVSSNSDRQLVPRRKSVSPRPPSMRERGVSPTPFSPDSYDALNPNASMGPIIGDDGREIDPSDHLPTDTWAPEPERKTKKPGVVVRFRNPAHRANPLARPTNDGTVERAAHRANPLARPTTDGIVERAAHRANPLARPTTDGTVERGFGIRRPPAYTDGAPNMGPPIPSKVPIAQAMNQNYPVLGGSMGMDALSRELNTIDIGSVGCSGGGRSLKKYAPKTMGYAV